MDDRRQGSPAPQVAGLVRRSLTPSARKTLAVDAPLAAVIGLAEFTIMQHSYLVEEFTEGLPYVAWWPYLMMWACSYVALAFRRIRPLMVFLVASVCLLVSTLLFPFGPALTPAAVAVSVFTLIRRQRLLPCLAILAGAVSVSVLQIYLTIEPPLRELSGRVAAHPLRYHVLVWTTAGVFIFTVFARLDDALWLRVSRPRGESAPDDADRGGSLQARSRSDHSPGHDRLGR